MTTEHRSRQGESALRFIREHIAGRGYPPSRQEIAEHLDLVPSTAQKVLESMVKDGLIEITPHTPRGIRVNAVARIEPV